MPLHRYQGSSSGWHNCFFLCLFWFITNYLFHHLTSPYNPQTIYCLESCFCCCSFLPASVPLLEVILHVSSCDLKCHCFSFFCLFCWWTCIHSRGPSFQSMGSKQGQELSGLSKQVSHCHGWAGGFTRLQEMRMFVENSFLQTGNNVTLHGLVHVLFFLINPLWMTC